MATVATGAGGAPFEERAVFVRKATGLVRGWSVRDAFIYATFAINLVTLGWYIFAFAPFTVPGGGLLWAVIVGGAYLIFQARAALIDSDEAITGLMARHILQGHVPIWLYGISYQGSLEAFSTAFLFALFGATPLVE